jgi:hypothetical protein
VLFGLSLATFTFLHIVISLIGIAAGVIWLLGAVGGVCPDRWNTIFLAATIFTSASGYLFPFNGFTPTMVVGAVSLICLAMAVLALSVFDGEGGWRIVYLVSATTAIYLTCFVLVIQAFLKIAPLHALAPTGTEPTFALVQGAVLVSFALLGFVAIRRTRRLAM